MLHCSSNVFGKNRLRDEITKVNLFAEANFHSDITIENFQSIGLCVLIINIYFIDWMFFNSKV